MPKFSLGLADTRAEEGSKLVLSCEVSSVPTPRIYWFVKLLYIFVEYPFLVGFTYIFDFQALFDDRSVC